MKRKEFAIIFSLIFSLSLAKILLFQPMLGETLSKVMGILSGTILLVAIIRRLRDINLSGWWSFIFILFQFLLAFSSDGIRTISMGGSFPFDSSTLVFVLTAVMLSIFGFIFFLILKRGTQSVNRFGAGNGNGKRTGNAGNRDSHD